MTAIPTRCLLRHDNRGVTDFTITPVIFWAISFVSKACTSEYPRIIQLFFSALFSEFLLYLVFSLRGCSTVSYFIVVITFFTDSYS